jgi:poly-gamma-glutamate synthesis protein (capsule biosynthesis protein)
MDASTATSISLLGNTFFSQNVSRFKIPRWLKTIELLRSADLTLANMECAIPDPQDPPAFVAGTGWAGTYMAGTPRMLEDLKYIGIGGVTVANNHVGDFAEPGVTSTIRHLNDAGLPYAGIGRNLSSASAATYIDTPSGLRVAVMAACDWGPRGAHGLGFPWPSAYFPSDDGPHFTSRPGVNLLRYDVTSYVSREQLDQLRQISRQLNWEKDKILRSAGFWRSHPLVGMTTNISVEVDTENQFYFLGRKFAVGDEPRQETYAATEDIERILKNVRDAKQHADIVMFALHDQSHGDTPHDFIRKLAHDAIDSGLDVFYNTGGSIMGVESYNGGAVLYGLPQFFLQTESVTRLPASAMLRLGLPADSSAADFLAVRANRTAAGIAQSGTSGMVEGVKGSCIATCSFDSTGHLNEVTIQPLEMMGGHRNNPDEGVQIPRYRRGLPLLPEPESTTTKRVLEYIRDLSEGLGTKLELADGVGRVRIQ